MSDKYNGYKVKELRNLCKERGITGYSSWKKKQLIAALEKYDETNKATEDAKNPKENSPETKSEKNNSKNSPNKKNSPKKPKKFKLTKEMEAIRDHRRLWQKRTFAMRHSP